MILWQQPDGSILATPQPAHAVLAGQLMRALAEPPAPLEPVVNAAGVPFDKGPERAEAVKVYTLRKYVNGTTKTAIEAAVNTTNSGALTINGKSHAVDTLWLADASYESVEGRAGVQ